MAKHFTIEEKLRILAELAGTNSRRVKSRILAQHGVDKRVVHKWRQAFRKGTLGARPGRKPDPRLLRLIDQAIVRPQVLDALRAVDDSLKQDGRVPEPGDVKKELIDEMVTLIDRDDDLWSGRINSTWVERVTADMESRISRRKGKLKEGDPTVVDATCDYLGDVPTNTPAEACRDPECPCYRLCGVHHLHQETQTPEGESLPGVPRQPPKIVCTSKTCEINRYCLSWTFDSPFHVHWPRDAPDVDLRAANKAASWSSPEDCPWHEVCDVAHERPDDSVMEVAAAVQATWQPVRLWCVDPVCPHHRRGAPHVHCPKCDETWPASVRYREIVLKTVSRDSASDADGLCEACYFEWKRRLLESSPPS